MNDKAQAMVLASLAADSLALGAHWIYDTDTLAREIGRVDRLLAPPQGSYHPTKKRGEFTHYGDQTLLLLESLAETGDFSLADFAERWRQFGTTTTGYLDRASKETLVRFTQGLTAADSGSPSTDLGGPARIAPLVYRYRNDLDTLLQAARQQTAMTHAGPGTKDGTVFIARCAFAVLHGATAKEAIVAELEQGVGDIDLDLRLRKAVDSVGRDSLAVIKEFGQMCAINAALPAAVHLILRYETDLRQALIENVMAGGDSAARGLVVGMILGAAGGSAAIPPEWLADLAALPQIQNCLSRIP